MFGPCTRLFPWERHCAQRIVGAVGVKVRPIQNLQARRCPTNLQFRPVGAVDIQALYSKNKLHWHNGVHRLRECKFKYNKTWTKPTCKTHCRMPSTQSNQRKNQHWIKFPLRGKTKTKNTMNSRIHSRTLFGARVFNIKNQQRTTTPSEISNS